MDMPIIPHDVMERIKREQRVTPGVLEQLVADGKFIRTDGGYQVNAHPDVPGYHETQMRVARHPLNYGLVPNLIRPPRTRPEQVIATQMLAATEGLYEHPSPDGVESTRAILDAGVYLWRDDIIDLIRSKPLPRHTLGRGLLPEGERPILFVWESVMGVGGPSDIGADGALSYYCLLREQPAGLEFTYDVRSYRGRDVINVTQVRADVPWGEQVGGGLPVTATNMIVAMLSFLRSPYVPKASARLPRGYERDLERAGEPSRPLIRFVDLRTAESAPHARSGPSAPHTARWMVRGHHRAQWYASVRGHRVIWIEPYVKGPAGAPLITSVARVKR